MKRKNETQHSREKARREKSEKTENRRRKFEKNAKRENT